jgi:uncharacterized protein YrrD
MLHSAKDMKGLQIAATDGTLGGIDDVYFDDQHWTIRYLVVKTGGWLATRKVLISPMAVTGIDWEEEQVHVNLSRQQVKDSPHIDADKPVSRQHEAEFTQYYGYTHYWMGPYLWGAHPYPGYMDNVFTDEGNSPIQQRIEQEKRTADPHLRSSREVSGYHIEVTDGPLGHVEDFLFDDQSWTIMLLVAETREHWPGKHVVVATQRISDVDWDERKVKMQITREELEQGPDYDLMSAIPDGAAQELYRRFWRAPPSP